MDTWSYGERVCLLCERPAYPTDYYAPNFEGSEPTAIIPLCQYHKASYMGHGLKKLDEMYREGKLREAEQIDDAHSRRIRASLRAEEKACWDREAEVC